MEVKTNKNNIFQKGFTLLELLLVITLISILITIGVTSFNTSGRFADARNDTRKRHIQTIENAITQYKLQTGNYPTGLSRTYQEICDPDASSCSGFLDLKTLLVPNYLQAIPQDPNDKDSTGGAGYSLAVDVVTNMVSVRALQSESNVEIKINDPLPSEETITANTELADTVPNAPPPSLSLNSITLGGSIITGGASNGTISIPYTGGLGQSYSGISLSSTGVTGLTASLTGGSLANGTGSLSFNITGTASGAGTATFTIPDIAGATGSFTVQLCPSNYIRVPGNSLYNTNNFCVMKYEAKAVSTSAPTVGLTTPDTGWNTIDNNTTATISANGRAIASVSSGYPIANINQNTAASYCTNAGASLISSTEWMTIARNIESQLSNWTTGTAASTAIGIGKLYIGHSDGTPNKMLEAGADNDGYIGTGQSGFSVERRTYTLSNGEVIWDLSGNMYEWNSDTIQGQNKPNNSSGSFLQEWTAISNFGTLSYDLTRPSNPAWNSNQNMGRYYAGTVTGTTTYAFLRGSSIFAGVFTLSLDSLPSSSSSLIGFRCVVR